MPSPLPANEHGSLPTNVRVLLAVLSVVAAGIHGTVFPAHAREGVPVGAFFASATLFQLGWALLVVTRPSRRLLLVGAVANAAMVAVWVISRSLGVPFGPDAGHPEAVGFADTITTAYEASLALIAVYLVRGSASLRAPTDSAGLPGASIFLGCLGLLTLAEASAHEHLAADGRPNSLLGSHATHAAAFAVAVICVVGVSAFRAHRDREHSNDARTVPTASRERPHNP